MSPTCIFSEKYDGFRKKKTGLRKMGEERRKDIFKKERERERMVKEREKEKR